MYLRFKKSQMDVQELENLLLGLMGISYVLQALQAAVKYPVLIVIPYVTVAAL